MLIIPLHLDVYMHYLVNVTRDRIVIKYCNFTKLSAKSHSRSKTPEISYGGRHSVHFVKLTLPI